MRIYCVAALMVLLTFPIRADGQYHRRGGYFDYHRTFSGNPLVLIDLQQVKPDRRGNYRVRIPLIDGINLISQCIPGSPNQVEYYCVPHNLDAGELNGDTLFIYTREPRVKIVGSVAWGVGHLTVFDQPFPEGSFTYSHSFLREFNRIFLRTDTLNPVFHGPRTIIFFYDNQAPVITGYTCRQTSPSSLRLNLTIVDRGLSWGAPASGLLPQKRYSITVVDSGNRTLRKTDRIYLNRDGDTFSQTLPLKRYRGKTLTLIGSTIADRCGNQLFIAPDFKINIP